MSALTKIASCPTAARVLCIQQSLSLLQRCEETKDLGPGFGDVALLVPFKVHGRVYGHMQPTFADRLLSKFPDTFVRCGQPPASAAASAPTPLGISLNGALEQGPAAARTDAVAQVNEQLRRAGEIQGWRQEQLPVVRTHGEEPAFLIERAACAYYGLQAWGVHVNGFERRDAAQPQAVTHIWVATRSRSKSTWPGLLDHLAAGGLPHGITPSECVVKECAEEAGVPEHIAATAQPTGALSYRCIDEFEQLRCDTIFTFDLDLTGTSPGFHPRPVDGEVQAFQLRSVDWVLATMCSGPAYKPNCSLVVIDFLLRRGLISPESPHYLELVDKVRA